MKGDFSRFTFDRKKHYSAVLMQQGRVQLDADWNEQQDINQYRAETVAGDTIGISGVPKLNHGFGIGVTADGKDLSISRGHLYVDGILCENDRDDLTVGSQDDYPAEDAQHGYVGFKLPQQQGRYLLYLDVWKHSVTSVEDTFMREKALGGPDTTTRAKTVWQVKMKKVEQNSTCAQFGTGWKPETFSGKLTVYCGEPSIDGGLCDLLPASGYQRLENQLYRIEIHRGGIRNEATFKWSRDNGSVVASIKERSGQELTIEGPGKDDQSGFSDCQWVEVLDDRMEMVEGRGALLKVKPGGLLRDTVEIDSASTIPVFDNHRHPRLRRWDHTNSNAAENGIPMTSGRTALEGGIKVEFSDGTFRPGDYWLFPARAPIAGEVGEIGWPKDKADNPHGIEHHFCPLALVDFDGGKFNPIVESDCRKLFPPLTAITASDVSFDNISCKLSGAKTVQDALDALCQQNQGICTVVLVPGTKISIEEVLKKISDRKDVHLCLQTGTYIFDKVLKLDGRETVKITGCGPGTKVSALESEVTIAIEKCTNVTVRDLSAKGTITKKGDSLNGVLTFSGCEHIAVDSVTLSCAGSTGKRSSCITVRPANKGEQGSRSVRIRHSNFEVGDDQVGILLVNAQRIHVEDNVVRVMEGPTKSGITERIKDLTYRAKLSKVLVSNSRAGGVKAGEKPPPLDDKTNTRIVYGTYYVHFATSRMITDKAWAELIKEYPPDKEIRSARDLQIHIESLAERVLFDEGIRKKVKGFGSWFDSVAKETALVGKQGIVVGGESAGEVRIINNSLAGFLQGIHIGVSHKESQPGVPDKAGFVTVTGNSIVVRLSLEAKNEERHGLFVGNCRSLMVENNHLVLERLKGAEKLDIEGIRIYGIIGQRMIIRHNHMEGFDCGIMIEALPPYEKEFLWLAADNIAPGAAHAVVTKNANVKRDDKADYNVPA